MKEAKIPPRAPDRRALALVYLDRLKQKAATMGTKIRRYRESNKRKEHLRLFEKDQKKFYRRLNEETKISNNGLPAKEDMCKFWNSMWGQGVNHSDEYWLAEEEDRNQELEQMADIKIEKEDVQKAIATTQNWKTPGTDKLHNFWLKHFSALHGHLATHSQRLIDHPEELPKEICMGKTIMIPKSENTQDPKEYRPITCLSNLYKLLTKILCNKITMHLDTIT